MASTALLIYKQRHKQPNDSKTYVSNYEHVKYIGTRTGVMLPHSERNIKYDNGFFGCLNNHYSDSFYEKSEILNRVCQMSKEKKTLFRSVISFNNELAEGLGLYTREDWIKYTKSRIFTIARENGIDIKNLEWVAAVHKKEGQPHVHIDFWDKSEGIQKQFIQSDKVEHLRATLIKETYPELLKDFYENKKISEKQLRKSFTSVMEKYEKYLLKRPPDDYLFYADEEKYKDMMKEQISIENFDISLISKYLSLIKDCVPKKGRLNYQFLPEDCKEKVDAYVDIIISSDEQFAKMIKNFVNSKIAVAKVYTSNPQKISSLKEEYTFEAKKIVANIILKGIKSIPTEVYENDISKDSKVTEDILKDIFFTLFNLSKINRSRSMYNSRHTFGNDLSKEAKKEHLKEMKDRGLGVER